jgi:alanine-synthesizing transaminase
VDARPRRHPRKITPNTKALVVINPNNPTGALYSDELLLELLEIARQHGLIVFADEVYDKIVYDGLEHTALGSLSEDVITVTFNSLSKSYRSCGYRAGWMSVSGLGGDNRRRANDYLEGPAFCRRCGCARTCRGSSRSRPRSAATRASTS